MDTVTPRPGTDTIAIPHWVPCVLLFGTRHWLQMMLILAGLYASLGVLAPWAMAMGWEALAHRLYGLYAHVCHQSPAASYFLFAPGALVQAGAETVTGPVGREFLGNAAAGFKTALCQRELAIYGSFTCLGLAYSLAGRKLRGIPLWAGLLLGLPMVADGLSQLVGWRDSTWFWRTLTGVLFSLGVMACLIPRIDTAMTQVASQLARDMERPEPAADL